MVEPLDLAVVDRHDLGLRAGRLLERLAGLLELDAFDMSAARIATFFPASGFSAIRSPLSVTNGSFSGAENRKLRRRSGGTLFSTRP
jgi:hypothetical protein